MSQKEFTPSVMVKLKEMRKCVKSLVVKVPTLLK